VPRIQVQRDRAAERRQQAAALYARGVSLGEIAEQLQCSQGTLAADLATMRRAWRERMSGDIAESRAHELLKLDEAERSLWESWRLSQGGQIVERESEEHTRARRPLDEDDGGEGDDVGAPLQLSRTIKERTRASKPGDAKYMELILRVIDQRIKLLGLADDKGKGSGAQGNTVHVSIDWTMIAQGGPAKPDPIEAEILRVREGGITPPVPVLVQDVAALPVD